MSSTIQPGNLFSDAARRLTLTAAKAQWDQKHPVQSPLQHKDAQGNLLAPDPSGLPPGYELLHSFYSPSLQASSEVPIRTINVVQTIEGPHGLPLHSSQDFEVIAPQFSLPEGDVHSVYPAQGGTAAGAVLPHMVFSDAHLPWERQVVNQEPEPGRNRTPWFALMAFTADELLLTPAELTPGTGLFQSPVTQSPTLAVSAKLSDMTQIPDTKAKNCIPDSSTGIDPTTLADFIFITPQVFNDYFATDPQPNGKSSTQSTPDLSSYRFLAHSRAINTIGMANAGVQDDGIFSVVVSRRCGVWSNTTPVPIFVHLVSLDLIDTIQPWPVAGTDHVALCSLYSWTYQCLPPASVDIADALTNLATHKGMLAPDPELYKALLNDSDQTKQRVAHRLRDGYTLNRYLLQDGEEAVSFYRGPFTSTSVPYPLTTLFTTQSTFSTDLQILDRSLGIMDTSYSSAWQLGRMLGLADCSFFTALGRLRIAIHASGLDQAKRKVVGDSHKTAADVAASLHKTLAALKDLHMTQTPEPEPRWKRVKPAGPDLSLWSDEMQESFTAAVKDTASSFSQSQDGGFYNEMNRPISSDWAVVLKWVLDRMFLFGIPAHYLVSDPSYLPAESLRYFMIDRNWIEAMLDGGLSLANHIEQDNDTIRLAIKTALAGYLTTVDPDIGFKPQVPTFGFLLRSDLVKQFPDLIVDIPWTTTDDPRAPLLRHENIDEGVMLVLLDRIPSDTELKSMTFTQPPHQQRFVAGATVGIELGLDPPVTTPTLEVEYKSIFTIPNPSAAQMKLPCGPDGKWDSATTYSNPVFDFSSRLLHVNNFAKHVYDNLIQYMPSGDFVDDVATAAMLAIQLNDPCYSVEIGFPGISPPPSPSLLPSKQVVVQSGAGLHMMGLRNRSQMPARYKQWLQTRKSARTPAAAPQFSLDTDGKSSQAGGQNTAPAQVQDPRSGQPRPPHYPSNQQLRLKPKIAKPSIRPALTTKMVAFTRDAPASQPKWDYGMWPIDSISSKTAKPPVPTQSGITQDLVISVVLDRSKPLNWNLPLQEVRLIVPVGAIGEPPNRTNLLDSYAGPGPVMLSNLRFNVEANFPADIDPVTRGKLMWLRILPRSVGGSVPVAKIDEMSILLPQAFINKYPFTPGGLFMQVTVDEMYIQNVTYQSTFDVVFDTAKPST